MQEDVATVEIHRSLMYGGHELSQKTVCNWVDSWERGSTSTRKVPVQAVMCALKVWEESERNIAATYHCFGKIDSE